MPKIENVDMSNRSIKEPNEIDHILWWFAAGNKEVLKDSVNSRFNYKIVGLAVMVTWIFATLSWFFYANTIFSNLLPIILMGGFMGFAILTIDRTLVSGKITIAGFIARLILATVIGAFVSEAWILFIYKDDINRQIPLITENKVLQQRNKIDSTYMIPKKELQTLINNTNKESQKKYDEIEDLRKQFFQEMDASGGSGRRGYDEIARKKERELKDEDNIFKDLKKINDKKINGYQSSIDSINNIVNIQTENYRKSLTNNGILIRYEAFDQLLSEDKTGRLNNRYYLLMAILIIFELIPLIAKYYIQDRSYQEKKDLIDNNEIEIAEDNANKDLTVKKERNRIALEKDIQLINILFNEIHQNRNDETKRIITEWKTANKSFDDLWREFKKKILSKQEN